MVSGDFSSVTGGNFFQVQDGWGRHLQAIRLLRTRVLQCFVTRLPIQQRHGPLPSSAIGCLKSNGFSLNSSAVKVPYNGSMPSICIPAPGSVARSGGPDSFLLVLHLFCKQKRLLLFFPSTKCLVLFELTPDKTIKCVQNLG